MRLRLRLRMKTTMQNPRCTTLYLPYCASRFDLRALPYVTISCVVQRRFAQRKNSQPRAWCKQPDSTPLQQDTNLVLSFSFYYSRSLPWERDGLVRTLDRMRTLSSCGFSPLLYCTVVCSTVQYR